MIKKILNMSSPKRFCYLMSKKQGNLNDHLNFFEKLTKKRIKKYIKKNLEINDKINIYDLIYKFSFWGIKNVAIAICSLIEDGHIEIVFGLVGSSHEWKSLQEMGTNITGQLKIYVKRIKL